MKNLPDNIYLAPAWLDKEEPSMFWFESPVDSDAVEYVRKDIAREEVTKKAVEWLRMNTDHYTDTVFAMDESFYEDFRKAMEESI